MRPCIEQSNGPVSLSPSQSWPDCIINMFGYDFRKGQGRVGGPSQNGTRHFRKLGCSIERLTLTFVSANVLSRHKIRSNRAWAATSQPSNPDGTSLQPAHSALREERPRVRQKLGRVMCSRLKCMLGKCRSKPQPHAAKLKKGGRRNRIPTPHAL